MEFYVRVYYAVHVDCGGECTVDRGMRGVQNECVSAPHDCHITTMIYHPTHVIIRSLLLSFLRNQCEMSDLMGIDLTHSSLNSRVNCNQNYTPSSVIVDVGRPKNVILSVDALFLLLFLFITIRPSTSQSEDYFMVVINLYRTEWLPYCSINT